MTNEANAHQTSLELGEPLPPEIPVGADITLKVRVRCASGCDLRGCSVRLLAGDELLAVCVLVDYDEEEEGNATGESVVKAPEQLGDNSWRILFPLQKFGDVVHEESALSVSFRTKPLATSLAVWDLPGVVVMGDRFKIKVGAKSSGASELKGAKVEILDEAGALVGDGTLGEAPWPGTSALYWTAVELAAPMKEGVAAWSARFAAAALSLPHAETSGKFSFPVVRPPEHKLKVRVVERDTESPIENAQVRVGAFRCTTDGTGEAFVALPKGIYKLALWKSGYTAPSRTVEVSGDTMLQVELVPLPSEDPDAQWM